MVKLQRVKVNIAGIAFDPFTERQLVDHVVQQISGGKGGWIVTANLDYLHKTSRDEQLRELIKKADITVADGTPVVWASRVTGNPLPERVAGADLITTLAHEDVPILLIGGEDEATLDDAVIRLRVENPRVNGLSPQKGFETDSSAMEQVRRLLDREPSVVFVGLGFPKQERLIDQLRAEFSQHWFVGIGAAINFAAGKKQRAPLWMQNNGLEWLHRLYAEPRRLFRRYLLEDGPFFIGLLARLTANSLKNWATFRTR